MIKPPRWIARNEREREQMIEWVEERLDELLPTIAKQLKRARMSDAEWADWLNAHGPEIEAADYEGNIQPLRRAYPHLARFLHAPLPRQRKKRPKLDRVSMAITVLPYIKRIWKDEYKLQNRTGLRPTLVEIAAHWAGVREDDIEKRRNPSGPSGTKPTRKSGPRRREKKSWKVRKKIPRAV